MILTKTDGDARGGAALSVRYVTGRPIKFIGVGEKTDGLEAVPSGSHRASASSAWATCSRWSSRSSSKVDQEKAQKLAEKVMKGKRFDLNDMRDQLEQMQNMGGLAGADGQAAGRWPTCRTA